MDALVDRLADAVERRRVAQPQPAGVRRRHGLDRAQHIAGGADALEIKVAREVVAARPQRGERRRQMRLERDEAADRGRRALAHRDAHALRRARKPARLDLLHAHHDAVAARAFLAHFDKAGDRRGRRECQHRMRDARGLQRGGGKAGGDAGTSERDGKAERIAARREGDEEANERRAACRPSSGFPVGGEIGDDAEAEGDRQPGQQPARRDFCGGPLRDQAAEPGGARGQAFGQHEPGAPARAVDFGDPSFGARAALPVLGHGAAPPTLTQLQPGSRLQQPQVAARGTVVNAHTVIGPLFPWRRPGRRCRAGRWCG